MAEAGLIERDLFITNAVACQPQSNSARTLRIFTFYLFTELQEPGDAFRRAIGLPPRDPEFSL